MKSINFGKNTLLKYRLSSNFILIFLFAAVVTFCGLPSTVAQEKKEQFEEDRIAVSRTLALLIEKPEKEAQIRKIIEELKLTRVELDMFFLNIERLYKAKTSRGIDLLRRNKKKRFS